MKVEIGNGKKPLRRKTSVVRLKDIAQDLGLSTMTISKALRGHLDVRAETRERVLKRLHELNYQPNLTARALITGRSWTIGLVVPDLIHPFFAQVAKAISSVTRVNGYGLLITSSEDDVELECQEIEQLLARRVDAMVIASSQVTAENFRRVEERRIPYVLIDRRIRDLSVNFVGVDDEAVGMLATQHLIEQGCKRIAHIRGGQTSTALGRLKGFKRALAASGLKPLPQHMMSIGASGDDQGEPVGYEAAKDLLRTEPRPDGIFCFNDPVAMGAMRAILEAKLRIPKDIALVGCGNVQYAGLLRVPLTSIDQDSTAIGKHAAECALSLIGAKRTPPPRDHLITPRLVVRASSMRS
jgi:LacI family transcriptional regulator